MFLGEAKSSTLNFFIGKIYKRVDHWISGDEGVKRFFVDPLTVG